MTALSLEKIAAAINAKIVLPESPRGGASNSTEGDFKSAKSLMIKAVAPIAKAGAGEITFLAQDAYAEHLGTTKATAVITASEHKNLPAAQLIHPNPYWAYAKVAQLFVDATKPASGVRAGAFVHPSAVVDPTAVIMDHVYIAAHAKIGPGTWLSPGVVIGESAVIGQDCEIRANVVIEHDVEIGSRVLIHAGTVIGADGFGFAAGSDGHAKIPQTGTVIIGDDVEIGALCTIDRGALEPTMIGRGTKIDSHVHVGHGVEVGEHCILCAFTGIAGSARLGNWVATGGHSAINNRCVLVDGAQVGAFSALTKSAPVKDTYLGFPAIPAAEWRRLVASSRRASDLEKKVRELQATVDGLVHNLTPKLDAKT